MFSEQELASLQAQHLDSGVACHRPVEASYFATLTCQYT
jgi:hypothetical protein